MKYAQVLVPWKDGLHIRPAALLVKQAIGFQATLMLRCGEKMADLRSIVSVILLGAACGAMLEIQATGEDEDAAVEAISAIFENDRN